MNIISTKHLNLAILLVAAAFMTVGCASTKPRPWNVSITKKVPATITVDLVGVTDVEKTKWEAYSMDSYWAPGDLFRANAQKITKDLELGVPWVVDSTDPEWNLWLSRGATYLLIVANMPSVKGGGPGDPRLYPVSIGPVWKGKTLTFEVYDREIRPLTPPK